MNLFSKESSHIQKLQNTKTDRRRALLGMGAVIGATGLGLWPEARIFAQQAGQFVLGPRVADIPAQQLSKRVWMVFAKDSFPTPENQGMMANSIFVVTSAGVVVIDTGSSLQIGQMAMRMIKNVTPLPVVAIFNTHYHGDHWLGNHAYVDTYGAQLPIYALPGTTEHIKGVQGSDWLALMERTTNQSTAGTKIIAPNKDTAHGQTYQFGDTTLRMHHYGTAHTQHDLCVEIVQDKVTAVGDIAMTNRIANIDDGSYIGTLKYFAELSKSAGDQLWVPGHGLGRKDLLQTYGLFLSGIWEPCLQAVKDGKTEAQAKAMVLADPRVSSRAKTMNGFDCEHWKIHQPCLPRSRKTGFLVNAQYQ